jgi:hypothetical protein
VGTKGKYARQYTEFAGWRDAAQTGGGGEGAAQEGNRSHQSAAQAHISAHH